VQNMHQRPRVAPESKRYGLQNGLRAGVACTLPIAAAVAAGDFFHTIGPRRWLRERLQRRRGGLRVSR
jgi:hypothetical protein